MAAEAEPETAKAPAQAESPAAPDANAEARSGCLRAKGSFTPTKTGAFICVKRTRDSSKGCSASGQCEGACLARSRSCSPVTPLVGCHDVLTDSGKRATVCVD
jgi:hypothetical protein